MRRDTLTDYLKGYAMNKIISSLPSLVLSVGLSVAFSANAFADEPATDVITSGSNASTSRITIFQPTPNQQPPADSKQEQPQITLVKKTVVYNINTGYYRTRAQRRKEALGFRYPGFKRQYSGYKYPF